MEVHGIAALCIPCLSCSCSVQSICATILIGTSLSMVVLFCYAVFDFQLRLQIHMLLDRALAMFPTQPSLCFTPEMEEGAGGGNCFFFYLWCEPNDR
jgi:hypothetical protein